MSGELLVNNSVFYADSGWNYRISSRTTVSSTISCYQNGNRGRAYGTIYDNLFTDNNLTMTLYYALADGGTWYSSSAVSWEAVNGTASRDLWCADGHARYPRWRADFTPYGGDGATYVDSARIATYGAQMAAQVISTVGYYLYVLTTWGYSTSPQSISKTNKVMAAGDAIIVTGATPPAV